MKRNQVWVVEGRSREIGTTQWEPLLDSVFHYERDAYKCAEKYAAEYDCEYRVKPYVRED